MKKDKVMVERFGSGSVIIGKDSEPQKRLMVSIPMTGSVRSEWMMARYGQIIPCNWSQTDHISWIDQYSPLRFLVHDARNLAVDHFLEYGADWLLFIDSDVCLPPAFLISINDYMLKEKVPVVSGLYFTKSIPAEPLVYRGRGTGYYNKWKMGDKVWVDGLPMGCTLIHKTILQALSDESKDYVVAGRKIKMVFETPSRVFYDPETHTFNTQTGTEDLEFCSQIMKRGIFTKAGWPEIQKRMPFPFLIDTRLFCWHIDPNGMKYPARKEHYEYARKAKK
jgi:hypothetical protein